MALLDNHTIDSIDFNFGVNFFERYCSLIDDGVLVLTWDHPTIPRPSDAELEGFKLPTVKTKSLQNIRAQAQDVIVSKWPLWKQINAQSGVYGPDVLQQCTTDIAAVIEASNTAEDAIDAATTPEQAEAVTATWPVI